MLELYYTPGASSFIVHAGLEIIRFVTGQPFTIRMVKLHKGEQHEAAFRAVNPQGQVPVLMVDGRPLTQVLAICDYLDRRNPEDGMLPREPWPRVQAMSQLAFMNNTAHPTFAHIFKPYQYAEGEVAQTELRRFNTARFVEHLHQLQEWSTAASPFWFGDRPTFHDVYAMSLLRWGGFVGIDPHSLPALWAHSQRVAVTEPVAAVMARERLELSAYRPTGA
jgi:glutathione S-transferase